MAEVQKKRVVILGGGLGGLSAAYYLSDTQEMRDKYEVVVYQLGWRLGGKCASGRNPQFRYRVEEHGIHVFSGFYANSFGMLRETYEALARDQDSPVSTCVDGPNPAFIPHNRLSLMEYVQRNGKKEWNRWDIVFDPDSSRIPGSRSHTLWHDMKQVCVTVTEEYDALSDQQKKELHQEAKPSGKAGKITRSVLAKSHLKQPVDERKLFDELSEAAKPKPLEKRKNACRNLCSLVKRLLSFLRAALKAPDRLSDDLRHTAMLIDLGLAIVRGMLKHRVLVHGFDVLDRYDFAQWLKKNGASPTVCSSPIVRSLYASLFAYPADGKYQGQPRLAAGVAVRVLWRTFFEHRGGFVWKMQAGMGEAVIAPLYQVLRKRNVQFKFFHRVDRLELSKDQKSIERVHVKKQVDLKSDYQPLLLPEENDDIDVPAWPSEPRYEFIDDQQAERLRELRERHVDLESAWMKDALPEKDCVLERRKAPEDDGYDAVVLAIPVGGLRHVCRELVQQNRSWRNMLHAVGTTQTQSAQLWLTRSAIELGWKGAGEEPLVVGYQKPLDAWVGMTQLVDRENWLAEDGVRHIGYFVTTAVDAASQDVQLEDADYPAAQHAVVVERVRAFLEKDAGPLWPDLTGGKSPYVLDWNVLVDLRGAAGPDRMASHYFRANINPSDRYVLSLPGSTRYRLPSESSGYDNLYLAGDWTLNGLNAGCAEAAVMSGMQAARGVSRRELNVFGEKDPTLPCRSRLCKWFPRRRRKPKS